MKTSIRNTRFTIGMVVFLVIILILSISSGFYLNRLSGKTNAILKENHHSVVHAQNMSEVLININQRMISNFLTNTNSDTLVYKREFMSFTKSLQLAKNNITEPGEESLISRIESDYIEYRDSLIGFGKLPYPTNILSQQKNFDNLYHKLILLSDINEKAIEEKTENAKVYAKKATIQMTFIGSLCFLIAYGFTFIFSYYFNERFFKLYNGIKEMGSNNFSQKLDLDGNDEIFEISSVFNEMAEKLNQNLQKTSLNLHVDTAKDYNPEDIQELKNYLIRIKIIEKQAKEIISRIEKI